MRQLLEIYQTIEDSLSTTIEIGHEQVDRITVARLLTIYKVQIGKNGKLADAAKTMILFFLTDDEFKQALKETT